MTTRAPSSHYVSLGNLDLGDIVTLPDGRELTVRARVVPLAEPVGSMTGFLLAGEVGPTAVLLAVPARTEAPTVMYTPLDHVPAHGRDATVVCEGAMSYWAPHLPGLSGAMGELTYKVCRIRGSVEPMVLIWRGKELVVFVASGSAPAHQLGFLMMPRSASTEVGVRRTASVVHGADERTTDPSAPLFVPEREPARLPVSPGRHAR